MPSQPIYIKFACPHCGETGLVEVGAHREIIRLSGGFHIEEWRLPGAPQVVICNICDEIDPPRLLPLP